MSEEPLETDAGLEEGDDSVEETGENEVTPEDEVEDAAVTEDDEEE